MSVFEIESPEARRDRFDAYAAHHLKHWSDFERDALYDRMFGPAQFGVEDLSEQSQTSDPTEITSASFLSAETYGSALVHLALID